MPADITVKRTLPAPADALNALARLTIAPLAAPDPRSRAFAEASIFFPMIGLLVGALTLGLNRYAGGEIPALMVAPAVAIAWAVIAADWRDVPLWWFALQLAVKIAALAHTGGTRGGALLFAPLLGCWSIVVVATGTRDAQAPDRKFNARINFHEFAVASVATAALMFTLGEAFGILVFACAGALVLLVRLLAHRLGQGVSWTLLRMTAQGIEAFVCILFALVA